MTDELRLAPGVEHEVELDAELRAVIERRASALTPISQRGGGEDWDAPLDLRVARPRATDLRALWRATNADIPAQLAGALGASRPVLITHTLTPFPVDGRSPSRVWGLGYELVAHDIDANTISVTPSDEVYTFGSIGQTVELGIDASGRFGVSKPAVPNAIGVRASTHQQFQFEVSMTVRLRKVVGAPVGIGGAQWKMYRQDEPLDAPHTLLQLVLVPEQAKELRCTVKTWAKQAGRLGTSWGAKFWPYEDQAFVVSLA